MCTIHKCCRTEKHSTHFSLICSKEGWQVIISAFGIFVIFSLRLASSSPTLLMIEIDDRKRELRRCVLIGIIPCGPAARANFGAILAGIQCQWRPDIHLDCRF